VCIYLFCGVFELASCKWCCLCGLQFLCWCVWIS